MPPDPKRAPVEVFAESEYDPVGVAQPRGWVVYGEGAQAMTFALTIGQDELPGLWVCVDRAFVPLKSGSG